MKKIINTTIGAFLLVSSFLFWGCDDILRSVTTNADSVKKELLGSWNIKKVTMKSTQNTATASGTIFFEDCDTRVSHGGECNGYYIYGSSQKSNFTYNCTYFNDGTKEISVTGDFNKSLWFGGGTCKIFTTIGKLKIETDRTIIDLEQ